VKAGKLVTNAVTPFLLPVQNGSCVPEITQSVSMCGDTQIEICRYIKPNDGIGKIR
jgi:hypothetical protein